MQPEDLVASLTLLDVHQNPTTYLTMFVASTEYISRYIILLIRDRNGPSEFTMIGQLKDSSAVVRLRIVKIPTLIINGEYDEPTDSVLFYGYSQRSDG